LSFLSFVADLVPVAAAVMVEAWLNCFIGDLVLVAAGVMVEAWLDCFIGDLVLVAAGVMACLDWRRPSVRQSSR